ncbi:MAG: PAS domain S-box protein [Thermodesulfobacteriota bacterium]|nr:PAS domain S-box protein [Thermodesulfobacteriota bacterium]
MEYEHRQKEYLQWLEKSTILASTFLAGIVVYVIFAILIFKNKVPYSIFFLSSLFLFNILITTWLLYKERFSHLFFTILFIRFSINFIFLGLMFHLFGGIEWIGAVFFVPSIIYVNFFFQGPSRVSINGIAVISYVSVVILEYTESISPSLFIDFIGSSHANTRYVLFTGIITVLVLISIIRTSSFFNSVLRRKAQTLEEEIEFRNKALQSIEDRFNNLIDQIPEAIFIIQDEKIKFINRFAEEVTGYIEEEIIGSPFQKFFPPENRESASERIAVIMNQDDLHHFSYEGALLKKDEQIRDVRIICRKVIFNDRPALQGCLLDITEEKKLRKETEETKNFLESLLDSSTDAIIATDIKGRVIFSNNGAREMMGVPFYDKAFRKVSSSYAGGLEEARRVMSLLKKDGVLKNYETQLILRDGRTIDVIVSAALLKNDKGEITGTVGVWKDISEERKMRREMEETKNLLEAIIESTVDAIVATDISGGIIFTNRGTREMLGYTGLSERRGEAKVSYAYAGGLEESRRVMSLLKKDGVLKNYETQLMMSDGKVIDALVSASLLNNIEGEVIGTVGIWKDITESKKTERALSETNKKLVKTNKRLKALQEAMIRYERLSALGELSGGIAHNFNNLLAIVLGRIQLALRITKEDKVASNLRLVERTVHDGAEMVSRIKEFVREKGESPFVAISFESIVDDVIEMMKPKIIDLQTDGIIIDIEKKGNNYPIIMGNPSELREVLISILSNAIEAMPKGGIILFNVKNENGLSDISISDSGVGMQEKVRSKIFEPFFTTKAGRGSGLGLSVAYGIISRHHGKISAESKIGRGTTITITLPRVDE